MRRVRKPRQFPDTRSGPHGRCARVEGTGGGWTRCRVLWAGRTGDVQYEGDDECRRREPVRPVSADALSVVPVRSPRNRVRPRYRPGQPAAAPAVCTAEPAQTPRTGLELRRGWAPAGRPGTARESHRPAHPARRALGDRRQPRASSALAARGRCREAHRTARRAGSPTACCRFCRTRGTGHCGPVPQACGRGGTRLRRLPRQRCETRRSPVWPTSRAPGLCWARRCVSSTAPDGPP